MEKFEKVIETDVLVIGGGFAGIFAAVKAKEQGADVTLVAKGNIGRAGQSPWAHGTMVVPPESTDLAKQLNEQARIGGEYINNRDWTKRVIDECYARFQDLLSWGQPFLKDENGNFVQPVMHGRKEPGRLWAEADGPESWVQSMRKYPQKIGVNILEKIMIVDLIKQDGIIAGAVGISINSWDFYVFKAKSVVMCAGSGGFKPVGGWPIGDLTADGHIIAYRAGAEITGKEFEDFHQGFYKKEGAISFNISPPWINAEGAEIDIQQGFNLGLDFEAHAGRAPIGKGKDELFGNVALGMSVHTAEGIWPVDENCFSGIPGLYAAGDSCGNMVTGAKYSLGGTGTANASVTGARAGTAAAIYARQTAKPQIDAQKLELLKKSIRLPATRKGGFSPNWVTMLLKNTMTPYFVSRIKHGDRLKAALTFIAFMRDHLSPMLLARDPHELRTAHETKNMIANAEMKLRASLYRTESRGTHYREDFPRRSDPEWLAWVTLKDENGVMKISKKPIPREWWPDLTVPYAQRYPYKYPGE